MGQDINLNNEALTPISSFAGTFDGRGKKIMNLTVDRTDSNGNVSQNAALFLELGSGGNIKNLVLKEFNIVGAGRVGSLVATSSGTITNCYAVDTDESTDLSGSLSYVGGPFCEPCGRSGGVSGGWQHHLQLCHGCCCLLRLLTASSTFDSLHLLLWRRSGGVE